MPTVFADSFTMCHTAFSVIPSTQASLPCDYPEQSAPINRGCNQPLVQLVAYPVRHRNSSDVTSLTNQIHNRPVLFALLKVSNLKATASCLLNPHASSSASKARSRFPFSC